VAQALRHINPGRLQQRLAPAQNGFFQAFCPFLLFLP